MNYLSSQKRTGTLFLLLLLIFFSGTFVFAEENSLENLEKAEKIVEEIIDISDTKIENISDEVREERTEAIVRKVEEIELLQEESLEIIEKVQSAEISVSEKLETETEGEVVNLIAESDVAERKIERETKKIETYTDQKEDTSSEKRKEVLEERIEEKEDIIAEEQQKKLENLEKINEVFAEKFEEDLEEVFVNTENTASGKKKAEELIEKITEEKILEAPIFFAFQEVLSAESVEVSAFNDASFEDQNNLSFIWGENLFSQIQRLFFPEISDSSKIEKAPQVVAVIDTGVDTKHEDLVGQFWISETCVDENGERIEGGCQNGGWDFVDNDSDPYDILYAHGTAVSGIVAAKNNNEIGISSLGGNGNVEIMALRACCSLEGYFEAKTIAKSIRFAVNNNADVINLSFGGPTHAQSIEDAIEYAGENGVMVVSAAGNYGTNNDKIDIYPANLNKTHKNVLSVGSVDREGKISSFSNYGQSVDIAAPGELVLTTIPGNDYKRFTGTSFSTPFVSGMMAGN